MNVEAVPGDGQDAEKVVQDALWTAVRKIDTFRGESAFGSWFHGERATSTSRSWLALALAPLAVTR